MLTIQLSPFRNLKTPRLLLRAVAADDAADLLRLRENPEVNKFLDREPAKNIEEIEVFIKLLKANFEANEGITWAITLQDDDRLIGTIGYWPFSGAHHRAEVGYMLHPDHWQKGIMKEALEAVLDFGFQQLKLHSVEANLNAKNIGSIRVLEKARFVREAYFKENYYYKGAFLDSMIYSKLAPII